MIIKVECRNVYGTKHIYPACDKSALFAELAGTKTLSPARLRLIRALGYEVKATGLCNQDFSDLYEGDIIKWG